MSSDQKEIINFSDKVNDQRNRGIFALAEAVDDVQLSLEETGAAQELLALASEASLSSPINGVEELKTSSRSPAIETDENANNNNSSNNNNTTTTSSSRKHVCSNCAATSTPFWRKSPTGLYYCNACGLYLRTHKTMRPLTLSKNKDSRRSKSRPEACGNCGASDTPMWRKTEDGLVVCNACGLYHKLHGQHRRVGAKRSSKAASSSSSGKQPKTHDFTLINDPKSNQILPSTTTTGQQSNTKYSLDTGFHHKFDPNCVKIGGSAGDDSGNNDTKDGGVSVAASSPSASVLPTVEIQPVDTRKLAYLKCSQGRTALIAPKLYPIDPQILSAPSPSIPPILTEFINSLVSSSPDNLNLDASEHPLQPLLTNIVSQKLKEQRNKHQQHQHQQCEYHQRCYQISPGNSIYPPQLPGPHENQQQNVYYSQDSWPVSNNQLTEFIRNQQEALYSQHMIQQSLYHQQYQQNINYNSNNSNNNMNGYTSYPQHQQTSQPNSYQHHQQTNQPNSYQHQHQQQQQYINNANSQNIYQESHTPDPPNPQQYFVDQFPEPPLRQLSPFSGIKFDKNLIDLVNLQFWQDNNNQNGPNNNSNSDNSNNF